MPGQTPPLRPKRSGGFLRLEPMQGRPSLYTPAIAAEICARMAEGESLRSICSSDAMPSEATVRGWALDDRDGFSARYARARELQMHALADDLLEIADDTSRDTRQTPRGEQVPDTEWIARARLRVDARKWLMSKIVPKVYGDKVQAEHSGPEGGPIQTEVVVTIVEAGPDGSEAV